MVYPAALRVVSTYRWASDAFLLLVGPNGLLQNSNQLHSHDSQPFRSKENVLPRRDVEARLAVNGGYD